MGAAANDEGGAREQKFIDDDMRAFWVVTIGWVVINAAYWTWFVLDRYLARKAFIKRAIEEQELWNKQGTDHVIDRSVLSPPPPACALPVGFVLFTAQVGVRADLSLLPL